ncbi:MAG: hypothetical protein AAF296_12565, partial [Pseudomonadota bacterium]
MADIEQDWERRLVFAALDAAVRVDFSWHKTADGMAYALRSYDVNDAVIGDGSDYDILKARISPLETLAEREGFADGH